MVWRPHYEPESRRTTTSLEKLATYLTTVLPVYGLRGVEITDFITYWVPQVAERYGGSGAMISVRYLTRGSCGGCGGCVGRGGTSWGEGGYAQSLTLRFSR